MKIRYMEATDIEAVTQGEKETLGKTFGALFFQKELTNPAARFWVAAIDDKVIGYLGAYLLVPDAEIINFYVLNSYQNSGYGRLLFNALLAECINKSIKIINLEVKEGNTLAINFYKKNDFNQISLRKQYYQDGSNALVMQKVIK